jgi:hypothetical protein
VNHAPTVKVVSPEIGLSGRDKARRYDLAVGDDRGDNYPVSDNYWEGTEREGSYSYGASDNYSAGDNYSPAGERDSITNNLAATGKNSCRRPAEVVDADHPPRQASARSSRKTPKRRMTWVRREVSSTP